MSSTTEVVPSVSSGALAIGWLEVYGDSLFAYAVRRVRRREIAEDLVQETLLAGIQAVDRFSHRSNVKTWLTGILRNKISDHLRARYQNDKLESTLDDDALFNRRGKWKVAVPRWDFDPERSSDQRELRVVLDGCISKLPTRMAHLFISRTVDEVNTAELCQELDISSENAWMLLHRARLRLRQCLTVNWFTEKNTKEK